MYDAQVIYAKEPVITAMYSEWFLREGANAWFTLEIVDKSPGSSTFYLVAYTKSTELEGDGIAIPNLAITATSPGIYSKLWYASAGFSELVRYGFGLQANTSGATEWAIFRVLPPSWFDSLKA